MTFQEIETKLGGHYHKGIIQSRIVAMWEIIGDNYREEFYDDRKAIIIPDEICYEIKKKINREVLSRSLSSDKFKFIQYFSETDWKEKLKRDEEIKKRYEKTLKKKKENLPYGIYCIKNKGEIIYIGMTQTSFLERWKEHKKLFLEPALSSMTLYHSNLNLEDLTFEVMVDLTKEKADKELTTGEIKAMEMGLIAYFKPKCNVSGVKIPYRFK